MKRVLLFLSLVVSFGYFAVSQTTNVPDKEKISFEQLLKAVSQQDLKNIEEQFCSPISELDDIDIKTVDFKKNVLLNLQKEFQKADPGYIYGPYHPRILNSAFYKYAEKYPPQLQQHEHPVAYQLLAEWESINTIRGSLLDEAYRLNPIDSGLYAEGVQLQKDYEDLKQEQAKLQAEVDQYNSQCAGQPVTPHCTNWYNSLTARIADYNRRVAIHNNKVENWKSRKQELDSLVGALIEKILSWESKINEFISKAREFLKDYTCTEEEHQQLKHAVWLACESVSMRCNKTQDCDTLRINIARHKACIDAHWEITKRCYNGFDPGHQEEIANREQGKKNCINIFEEKCGPYVPDPAFRTINFY